MSTANLMEIEQILPDPILYRAVLPDEEGIIQKPLRGPRRHPRAFVERSVDSESTDDELTATGRFRAPQGQSADQVGSEEKDK